MKTREHRYSVRPTRGLPFPIDMLRYDGSTVADEESSRRIERTHRFEDLDPEETVNLVRSSDHSWKPNAARWESYGWRVLP